MEKAIDSFIKAIKTTSKGEQLFMLLSIENMIIEIGNELGDVFKDVELRYRAKINKRRNDLVGSTISYMMGKG